METESNVLAKIGNLVGSSEAALRLLLSVFAGYPLALLHRKYIYGKEPNLQHTYFFVTGFALGYFNYGLDILHPLTAMLVTYLILIVFGGTVLAVVTSFVFNMGYLLIGYYCVGTDNYDINWTMPQCIIVLRLIGLTYDVYDGQQPPETLSKDSKKVALEKVPAFLETCGYVFFPTSFLVGPQFPLTRYREYVAGKYGEGNKHPPNSVEAAVKRLALGVMFLMLFLILGRFVSDEYIISDEFNNINFLKKGFLLGVWGRFTLYKYISCWLLTEGACILFGITYNGENEQGVKEWNGVENVKVSLLENATEFNHYILSFNINTNTWVAQYIYKRLKFLGNRYYSQGITLLFLAVWHGFHSGYYVCFTLEFIVMYLEKDLKSIIKSNAKATAFFERPAVKIAVFILLRIYTFVFMGWCLLPFALLTYDRYWHVFRALNHIGFVIFCLYPIVYGPLLRMLLKSKSTTTHQD
ncbi:hypothetical protein RN001_010528 [Aquatica leii]|uniref:Lysophospholipid acyltransferase 5 n=1 Tax=Aquatica leii TaxID=1421715 RepID=A0AAN7P6P6_9COLE|nr:hypothetical protein RN001_010528 [Aquatica leii]